MRKSVIFLLISILLVGCSAQKEKSSTKENLVNIGVAEQNMRRAMALVDSTMHYHFSEKGMARYYNPYNNSLSEETGSVWMYTSGIEAVNAILCGLKTHKEHGNPQLYKDNYDRYVSLLEYLYENLDYYLGTFTLTSYTQTKEWTVYGVHRATSKGNAKVAGIENVYDDQQWLVRELLESYRLTGNQDYFDKAEYLTEYTLDGWDCTLDEHGKENGGITWGPGYTSKHACSNGPMVSPMVWLYELYKDKDDKITYLYIDSNQNRKTNTITKRDYYLKYAQAIYDWQKKHLLRADGVFHDLLGGCVGSCDVAYEVVNGTKYRKHTQLLKPSGRAYTYNTGSLLSGAADLYRATKDDTYLNDAKAMADSSFLYFAKFERTIPQHYTYPTRGFSNWFNGVLLRSYVDIYPEYKGIATGINSFQQNLDYGYANHLYRGVLPTDLLAGWSDNEEENNTEGMFSFTYAAEYAVLARYLLKNKN